MFSFDESKYISDVKFFAKAPDESTEAVVEDIEVEKNETLPEKND
jgi:hypothetical protein